MKKILLGAAAGVGLVVTTIHCMVVSFKAGKEVAYREMDYSKEVTEKMKKLEETIESIKTANK